MFDIIRGSALNDDMKHALVDEEMCLSSNSRVNYSMKFLFPFLCVLHSLLVTQEEIIYVTSEFQIKHSS